MNIEAELNAIVFAKKGNKEIALFYNGKDEWTLSVGNTNQHVMLGEVNGEFETSGKDIEDVIFKMKTFFTSKVKTDE